MRSVVAVGWLLCLSLAASQLLAASPRRWIESLPSASEVIDGYMCDGVEERIAIAASNPIEDVWKLVATGGLIAVERMESHGADVGLTDCYRMIVLRSPDRAIKPGTVMGYLQPTAANGTFEARIYTDTDGNGTLTDAKSFRIVVTEDAMQFYRVRSGLSVNIFRMLPYMFRRAVDYRPDDHNGLDGCVRYRSCSLPRYF
jgi:hypothetical protein